MERWPIGPRHTGINLPGAWPNPCHGRGTAQANGSSESCHPRLDSCRSSRPHEFGSTASSESSAQYHPPIRIQWDFPCNPDSRCGSVQIQLATNSQELQVILTHTLTIECTSRHEPMVHPPVPSVSNCILPFTTCDVCSARKTSPADGGGSGQTSHTTAELPGGPPLLREEIM